MNNLKLTPEEEEETEKDFSNGSAARLARPDEMRATATLRVPATVHGHNL